MKYKGYVALMKILRMPSPVKLVARTSASERFRRQRHARGHVQLRREMAIIMDGISWQRKLTRLNIKEGEFPPKPLTSRSCNLRPAAAGFAVIHPNKNSIHPQYIETTWIKKPTEHIEWVWTLIQYKYRKNLSDWSFSVSFPFTMEMSKRYFILAGSSEMFINK
jgi:hypothetical protein